MTARTRHSLLKTKEKKKRGEEGILFINAWGGRTGLRVIFIEPSFSRGSSIRFSATLDYLVNSPSGKPRNFLHDVHCRHRFQTPTRFKPNLIN